MKKVVFALSALALTSGSVFAADSGDGTVNLQVKSSMQLAYCQLILRIRKLYWVRVQKICICCSR